MSHRALSAVRLKRWLKPVGWVFIGLALFLVAHRLFVGGGADLLARQPSALWTALPAALAYGTGCMLLSIAWWALLKPAEPGGMRLATAHRIYALSQIGKYLPGNVMHFVGRAAMAKGEGVPLTRAGFTMVQESVLMMTAALGLAAALGGTEWLGIPPILTIPAVVAAALAAAGVCSAPEMARRYGIGLIGEKGRLGKGRARLVWTLLALLAYAVFFCLSGGIVLAILEALDANVPVPLTLAAVCAAWLAGFVTPGASAGIGVREAVLIAALEPEAGSAAAATALTYRLVTTGGDVLVFASGAAARRWLAPPTAEASEQRSSYSPRTD